MSCRVIAVAALSALCLGAGPSAATKGGGGYYAIGGAPFVGVTGTYYLAPTKDGITASDVAWWGSPIPASGTAVQFCVRPKNLPVSGRTRTWTVRLDQSNTTLTCTVSSSSSPNRCCSTASVPVTAGEQIDIYSSSGGSGSPVAAEITSWNILVRK